MMITLETILSAKLISIVTTLLNIFPSLSLHHQNNHYQT